MLVHYDTNTHNDGPDSTKTQPSWWNKEHKFGPDGSTGDMMIRNTGTTYGASWLSPGTAGQVLKSNGPGNVPSWADVLGALSVGSPFLVSSAGAAQINLGGATASFPAIVRNAAQIDFLLADLSNFANVRTNNVTASGNVLAGTSQSLGWASRSILFSTVDGNIVLSNNAAIGFGLLQLGGTSASFPAVKRSSATAQLRLADDSAFAEWQASFFRSPVATGGIGYATGAGGTVTQNTNKSTGVTLNTVTGQITLNNAALAGDTTVSFTLTNSAIAATDHVLVNHVSGGTVGSYTVMSTPAGGSATITVRNITTGSLSEAIVIQFTVIKAVTS